MARRKLRLGKLAIYGAAVFSDFLAEIGAGLLRYAPVALQRAAFVVGFLFVWRFSIITIVAVGVLVVLASFFIHRKRKHPQVVEERPATKRINMRGGQIHPRRA